MKRFLIISKEGKSAGICNRILDDGNFCVGYVGYDCNYDYKQMLTPNPDCIIFDSSDNGYGKLADTFRSLGYPVVGGCNFAEILNSNPEYNKKLMKLFGIKNVADSDTFDGMTLTIEVYYDKKILGVHYIIDDTHIFDNNIGPNVGCIGSTLLVGKAEDKLIHESIKKILPALDKIGYQGLLNIQIGLKEDKLYGLKLSLGFNFNSIYSFLELCGNTSDVLYAMATGKLNDLYYGDDCALAVDIGVFPFPFTTGVVDDYTKPVPLSYKKHVWIYNMSGKIATVTARGKATKEYSSIREAKRRVYRTISNLNIKDLIYKNGVGNNVPIIQEYLKQYCWL